MAGRSPVATKTNMKAVELEEDDCGEEWIDYPFHRIVQPNDHDVLILSKKNSSWEDEELADHPGNVRFQTLLEQHASEYREKSKIEKPVVAANILSSWRSMDPPGRFLKLDSETNLWNDIGAKKSREKISALLKSQFGSCSELLQTEEDKQGGGRETPAALPGDKFKLEHVGPGTTSGIKKESFARQEKRISAKLDCVNDQNRLYGREKETQELIGVFRRHTEGSSSEAKEMCLISGAGGVGKTALAYSLRSHVEQQSGLFIQGKLERKSIHESFDVFVLAMADFAYQITSTEGTAEIDKYRAIFSETFGTQELKILLAIVPALCVIVEALPIDDGGPAEIEKGLHTAKMLTNIFQRFLQVIAKPESPVVLLFEDLHWASEASMELIATLIADVENRSVFFIATATDDLDDAMPSQRRLDHLVANLRSKHIRASSFSLEPLDKVAICEMLGDKLSIAQDQAEVLSKIVFSLTGGNMLFTREVLRKLQEDELVWFDDKRMEWKFDSHLIRSTVEVKDVHDLLKKRLLDISASARETLMAASCLGSVVDESLLSKAFSFSVSSCLQEAAVKGLLVLDQCTGSFCFAHDAAQQAAYSLIPEAEREAFHDRLGRKLWRKLDEKELDEHIFVVLDQLMVQGNTREGETVTVASYCLRAGEKAFRMSMFLKASAYLDYGIAQLGNRGWRDNYALSLKLHEAAAEVSCCIAQYDKVELLVKMIYAESRSFEDSLTARATFIHSLGILGRPVDALESALGTLRKMNESLPSYPSGFQVVKTLWKTKIMLRKRSDGSLLRLPLMTDRQKLATMQILSAVLLHALYVRPSLLPLLACRMVALTLDSGLCAASSVGFAYYGMVLCRYVFHFLLGAFFGEPCVSLLESTSLVEGDKSKTVTATVRLV